MADYRRAHAAGGTFFFTVVTERRHPLLLHDAVREALRMAVTEVRRSWPFQIDAWVLLPEHMHCIWTLPEGDGDYSPRWAAIKRSVTRACYELLTPPAAESRRRRSEGALWQRRFWEHQIRDELDYRRHVDYSYWNPVKHGLVGSVIDWPYSTFHRDVRLGRYPADWGGVCGDADSGGFGEPV